MDIRIENKKAFYASGYSLETSEASLEKDRAMLRVKYEDMLRPVSNHLYFLSWQSDEGNMVYHFSVETPSLTPATEGATCVEVPATRFAVATVPADMPVLAAWHEFFENGIASINATIDMGARFYCESYDENEVCELWIPIKA